MLLIENKKLRQAFGALETANFLLLKLALKNPSNLRWFPGRMFRSYMRLVGDDRWVSKGIFELFPSDEHVRISVEYAPREGVGERLDAVAYLAWITRVIQPQRVFEIGTFRGRTALNFALNSPPECRVFTMDLPHSQRASAEKTVSPEDARLIRLAEIGVEYAGTDVEGKIEQLWADSQTFDFTPYYGSCDLVFIDGAHHYDAVIRDTENAKRMLRPGGVIIWDNFSQYGDYHDVTRAVLDAMPPGSIAQIEDAELAVYRDGVTFR